MIKTNAFNIFSILLTLAFLQLATISVTATASTFDSDNDGVTDTIDLDDDNDGIPDLIEGAAPPPNALLVEEIWWSGSASNKFYVNFSSGTPVVTSGTSVPQTGSFEGTATLINPLTGELLLLTDGNAIYNGANGNMLANGDALGGHSSSTEAALIVPKPGSTDYSQFYVFSNSFATGTGATEAINYAEIDMNQGVDGTVTSKGNQLLAGDTGEALDVVPHANGQDYWVLAFDTPGQIKAFLVNSSGISTTPVTSATGMTGDVNRASINHREDFSKLALSYYDTSSGVIAIADIDRNTGQVSNVQQIQTGNLGYATAFSPDGSKLYYSIGSEGYSGVAWQYDLNNNVATSLGGTGLGGPRLAPDKKIYWARYGQPWLAVVNNPDNAGTASNFVADGLSLGDGVSAFNLQNQTVAFTDFLIAVGEIGADRDNDGIPNRLDLDSDGDGIPDNIEAQATASYIAPNNDSAATYSANNGLNSAYGAGLIPVDTDQSNSDGNGSETLPDYLDTNSDDEGLNDTQESGFSLSGNVGNNGLDDTRETSDDYTDVNGILNDPTTLPNVQNNSTVEVDFREASNTHLTLQVRALLQGAYDMASGLMRSSLHNSALLPLNQPYTAAPFNYSGAETLSSGLSALTGNNTAVDWVLVELRAPANATSVLAAQAAILQRDGDIIDAQSGSSTLTFGGLPAGNYLISVRHRNHLDILTAQAVTLNTSTPALADFTLSSTLVQGDYARIEVDGKQMLWAGDVNADHRIISNGPDQDTTNIFASVLSANGNTSLNANFVLSGYHSSDVNMDGKTLFAGPGNDVDIPTGNVLSHTENSLFAANFVIQGGMRSLGQ
ncbi:MAG: hypothetical protein ACPGVP_01975 [Thiolinea sp.]